MLRQPGGCQHRGGRATAAAETKAEQIDRAHVELDERPLAQPGEHALGQLQMVEAEAGGIRVERQRVDATERREVRETTIGPHERLGTADDARLHVEVRLWGHEMV